MRQGAVRPQKGQTIRQPHDARAAHGRVERTGPIQSKRGEEARGLQGEFGNAGDDLHRQRGAEPKHETAPGVGKISQGKDEAKDQPEMERDVEGSAPVG